jgi:hypothetical protein
VVIDLSACGVLVEAVRPLRPGANVDVQLETDAHRGSIAALVVRCAVAAIDSESITYRAALSFTESCEWVREGLTQAGHELPWQAGDGSPIPAGSGNLLPVAEHADARVQTRGTK